MQLLGYNSPIEEYSQGRSLLNVGDDTPVVIMGWSEGAVFDGQNYIIFSTESYNPGRFEIRDRDYALIEDEAQALKGRGPLLRRVSRGMGEFLR